MSQKPTFIYTLNLVRLVVSTKDEAVIDEHREYLKKGLIERKLILAGRCLDEEFGIVVFSAESEKQAVEFMENDPAVKNGLMTAELHPFRISLTQKDQPVHIALRRRCP